MCYEKKSTKNDDNRMCDDLNDSNRYCSNEFYNVHA